MKKVGLVSALALSLAMSQFAVTAASAEQTAHFRTAAPQAFSSNDLQRYGLSSADASKVAELQAQGYQVQLVTPEQARQMNGGEMSRQTWWIIGGVVLVAIIVAASN